MRDRFALFAECLLTGVWLTVAALPLITAPAAFAAACSHLDRHLNHQSAGFREFAGALRGAWRGSWRVTLAGWAVLGVLILDIRIARSGLPGGAAVAVVTGLCAVAVLVIGMRAAAAWRPGAVWGSLARAAGRGLVRDPGGSMLLAGGLTIVAAVTWAMPPLLVPALGCLAAAALAVERRGRA